MRKHGFFLAFFQTIFEFYEGVFKMTVFLPFTLLQAWHISRATNTERQLTLAVGPSPPSPPSSPFTDPEEEKPSKVSWDKSAQPKYSILKNTRENQEKSSPPREQNIVNKLELIGREIELISDLLSRTDRRKDNGGESSDDSNVRRRRGSLVATKKEQNRSQSLDTELETRSTSFQDLRNIFQEKSQSVAEVVIEKNADTKVKPCRHPEVEVAVQLLEENVDSSCEETNNRQSSDVPGSGKSVREMAEMYQSQIIEGTEDGRRKARKGKGEKKMKSNEENLNLDTTVLSITDSFTEPITLEAFINEKSEKCSAEVVPKEKNCCLIETNAEVHSREGRRPLEKKNKGRKKQAKAVKALGKSEIGSLLEDEEKVCLATTTKTTSGGSKKKTFSRPESRKIFFYQKHGIRDIKDYGPMQISVDPATFQTSMDDLLFDSVHPGQQKLNTTNRKSVSTSQLNTELEEETKVADKKSVKGKKISKKTKKKKIFLTPQELLAKFKQEKLLKDFWTTTKDEEEYLRSRSSDND